MKCIFGRVPDTPALLFFRNALKNVARLDGSNQALRPTSESVARSPRRPHLSFAPSCITSLRNELCVLANSSTFSQCGSGNPPSATLGTFLNLHSRTEFLFLHNAHQHSSTRCPTSDSSFRSPHLPFFNCIPCALFSHCYN